MSLVMQIAGVVAVTAGVCLLSIPAGVIVGGAFLILVGFALGK